MTRVQDLLVRSTAWREAMLGHFLILLATALLARWLFGFAGAVLALLVVGLSLIAGTVVSASVVTNLRLTELRDLINGRLIEKSGRTAT